MSSIAKAKLIMKKVILPLLATLALLGCASGPSSYQLEREARARADAEHRLRVEAVTSAYDRLRMPDHSTYSQKSAQLYGYIAMFLGSCDVLPSTQEAVTWNLLKAQHGLKTSQEEKGGASAEAANKAWLNSGIVDAESRTVDCRIVRARLLHWRDWGKMLANTTTTNKADAKDFLVILEREVGDVLARSPKSK